MRRVWGMMVLLAAGCGPASKPEAANTPPPAAPTQAEQSTAALVVDGITGRGAVSASQRARRTIEAVSKEKNKDLKDAIGE